MNNYGHYNSFGWYDRAEERKQRIADRAKWLNSIGKKKRGKK